MIENIIDKLKFDINCELSIEELRVLYEIDNTLYYNLRLYRDERNNYNDFCKMFNKKFVASTPNEINENTLCYIGDLLLEYEMYTHNLRYIYGDITSWFDKVKNLENLEIVYGNVKFDYLKEYKDLDNLRIIDRVLSLNYIDKADFSSLEYVDMLFMIGLESAKDIVMPEHVKTLWLPSLKTCEGLVFPKGIEQLNILDEKLLDKLILPDCLEIINVGGKIIKLNKVKKK